MIEDPVAAGVCRRGRSVIFPPHRSLDRCVRCYATSGYLTPQIRIISGTVLAPAAITRVTKAPSGAKKISVRTDSVCLTFPDAKWAWVDVSGNSARCGVRCAARPSRGGQCSDTTRHADALRRFSR
ncbi:hypothetical protein KCP73_20945 [Salmonella enterica subsp. enterica]|nr:hypothetical protein KCP73_20945 [Salmonella enterica subsp. enterica]